jgi:hypothetical protein
MLFSWFFITQLETTENQSFFRKVSCHRQPVSAMKHLRPAMQVAVSNRAPVETPLSPDPG